LTQTLARALAPEIAVNAVAPGPVLLPEDRDPGHAGALRAEHAARRLGHPDDVVAAVRSSSRGPIS
jgi:NAD(P)-dependent dehydrogenase (short-subunit alcohol dehydrogenase family)